MACSNALTKQERARLRGEGNRIKFDDGGFGRGHSLLSLKP